jgi:hypothetical protein
MEVNEPNLVLPLRDILTGVFIPFLAGSRWRQKRRARLRLCSRAHYNSDPDFKTPAPVAWSYAQYHGSLSGEECAKMCRILAWVGWHYWPFNGQGFNIVTGPEWVSVTTHSLHYSVDDKDLGVLDNVERITMHVELRVLDFIIHVYVFTEATDVDDLIIRSDSFSHLRSFLKALPRMVIPLRTLVTLLQRLFPSHSLRFPGWRDDLPL